MALCDIHFHSKTLGKNVGMNVIIPDEAPTPLPTFYLLHGLSDDYTGWIRRSNIERYAGKYPFLVVMPDGYRGFYTNNADGPDYATFFTEELIAIIERMFPVQRTRASRAIGGLSMGGYGALRLALGFPQTYASTTCHSGAVMHASRNHLPASSALGDREFHCIFGPKPAGSDHDLVALAKQAASSRQLPKIRIDCGVDDGLLDDNRQFHTHLEALRVPHEYEEFPGAHDWNYWDLHVQDALAFHAKNLATS